MRYPKIREEELKIRVGQDFFSSFDCSEIIRDIDFAVKIITHAHRESTTPLEPPLPLQRRGKERNEGGMENYLLWAEAKQKTTDILAMLTQLVLTIGKARTFDRLLPPPFLGCFDCEKIAFVPYAEIQDIFYQNDFNWNVAPSDGTTREFKQVYKQIEKIINDIPWETYIFDFEKDEQELKRFIRQNFIVGKIETSKIRIDKNNFITIYNKWLETVKPTIQVEDWTLVKQNGIMDGDFYLADLLSADNKTLREKLSVLLKTDLYELNLKVPNFSRPLFDRMGFSDNQKAYNQFWSKYERPPLEEYWDYIVDHRHLLAPQDVRERKGSFYTPKMWVELSQKYLADVFGKDWQDEYYIWDCAAGTGNLLAGLTNKYNIWASTLDKTDVDVMKDRIHNGANLLESHVFQFDFLNDDFTKLPKGLQDIVNDPLLRKKLIIYINPPYAEVSGDLKANTKKDVAKTTVTYRKYLNIIGHAGRELFAQFLIRIYNEIPSCKIANFSKVKALNASNFSAFRDFFQAKIEKMFVCPANNFDNVKGKFPIGFHIWDTEKKERFVQVSADVFGANGVFLESKFFYSFDKNQFINKWISAFKNNIETHIGFLAGTNMNDFQSNNIICVLNQKEQFANPRGIWIVKKNLIQASVFFAVRHCISATWLNDRDQFLYPNNGWKTDFDFQNDCLAYTLFHNSNNISTRYGVNHWIPFTENEVNADDKFESHFMMSFIGGKIIQNRYSSLFEQEEDEYCIKREFSSEAKKVFDAGRLLWRYYHAQPKSNVNASYYDIREYFQGRDDKGKMNNKSADEKYNELIGALRAELKKLATKIEPKVYTYGFLIS